MPSDKDTTPLWMGGMHLLPEDQGEPAEVCRETSRRKWTLLGGTLFRTGREE